MYYFSASHTVLLCCLVGRVGAAATQILPIKQVRNATTTTNLLFHHIQRRADFYSCGCILQQHCCLVESKTTQHKVKIFGESIFFSCALLFISFLVEKVGGSVNFSGRSARLIASLYHLCIRRACLRLIVHERGIVIEDREPGESKHKICNRTMELEASSRSPSIANSSTMRTRFLHPNGNYHWLNHRRPLNDFSITSIPIYLRSCFFLLFLMSFECKNVNTKAWEKDGNAKRRRNGEENKQQLQKNKKHIKRRLSSVWVWVWRRKKK